MHSDGGTLPNDLSPREMTGLLQHGLEEEARGTARHCLSLRRARWWVGLLALALVGVSALAVLRPPASSQPTRADSSAFEAKISESGYGCLDSYELSDFSSKGNMELAGWSFNWDDEFTFKPPIYQMYAPSTAYWGCSKNGGGTISLTLQGQGVFTLDYGNSWGNETSSVTVFLNGAEQSVAGPYTFSKTVKIMFNDGDTLDIVEGPSGVIVINSITFVCFTTTMQPTFPPTMTTTTTTFTTFTFTTTTITTASTNDVVVAPEPTTVTATTITTTIPTTLPPTTTTAPPTTTGEEIEKAKQKWLHEYDELQRKRLEERKKKEQLEHQLDLEQKVLERIKKERKELAEATAKERAALKEAKAAREREQQKRDEMRKERKHKEQEQKEEQQVSRETKLARAVAKQRKHTRKELQRLKSEREHEQKEEEVMAENMENELEKADGGKHHGPTTAPDFKAPSLYCYSLTLPFGYEPALMRAQKDRGVGIFECNEWAVFSNSSTLLDKGGPMPLKVTLVNFSLAVPYGGKWHTALNTGVFNGVWTTIVSLGNYRMHDWVVKADPDSVFFPKRLVDLLQKRKPMSEIMNTVSTRRLTVEADTGRRLQWHVPENASCGSCKMPGFEGQTCNSHVQYIQQQGHSCSEAIRRVARPPPTDCGCDCNRIEACDFKMDPKMYTNYQVIEGKAYPGAMYINNCKFGLHGPIEVLSQRALTAYVEGLPRCNNLLVHPWGEDKFMDRCMLELGITRVNEFGLLNEIACGETPAPCGDADVAFHPFKSIHSYFACWEYANRYGHGPMDPPGNASSNYVV